MERTRYEAIARMFDHLSTVVSGAACGEDCEVEAAQIVKVYDEFEARLKEIVATDEGAVVEENVMAAEGKSHV